ncbi:MAG: preprotein translocase subunit SecE [Candidatus Yonathbacteria bacterium]|nr:preprotein translocase subunit SecE [Candidatus Yonathbacteria bacterium]
MSFGNNAITKYIADSYTEMKKVVWPTRQETVNHTLLVIAISLGVAAFIGAIDYILNLGIEQLIR